MALVVFVGVFLPAEPTIGRVHRSVVGSFMPVNIILPLYLTTHFSDCASCFCEYTDSKEGGN